MAESTTTIKWQPNEEYLQQLIELGISREKGVKALKRVNNRSVDEAATYLFENEIHTSSSSGSEEDNDADDLDYKMVFVVNSALKMSTGKIAAQVAHAAIDLFQSALNSDALHNTIWLQTGQRKIVLIGENEQELSNLYNQGKQERNVFPSIIYDAGRTEVAPNSVTCMGLYGPASDIDKITGKLRLLK